MVFPRTPTTDNKRKTEKKVEKTEGKKAAPSSSDTEAGSSKDNLTNVQKRLRSNSIEDKIFYEIGTKNEPEKISQESIDRKAAREKLVDFNRSLSKQSPEEEDIGLQFLDSTKVQEELKKGYFIPKLDIFSKIPTSDPKTSESGAKSLDLQRQEAADSAYDTFLGNKESFDHDQTNLGGEHTEKSKVPPSPSPPPPSNTPSTNSRQNSREEEMANPGITLRDVLAYKIKFFDGVEKELDGFINTCQMYDGMTPQEFKPSLLTLVKARITGEALSKIQPIEGYDNLQNLLLNLKNAIRKPLSYELASERLNNVFQKPDETVDKYAHNIREALQKLNESSSKVSDNVEERSVFRKAHERLAVAKFIQNLHSSEIRIAVAAANKKTLEECVTYALERELTEKTAILRMCSHCSSTEHKVENCTLKKDKEKPEVAVVQPQVNRPNNMQFLNNYFRNRFPRQQQPFRSNFQSNFQLPRGSTPFRSYFPPNNANFGAFRPRFNNFNSMQPNTTSRDFVRNERQFPNRSNGSGNNINNGNNNTNPSNNNSNFSRSTPNVNTQPQGFNRNNYSNNRNTSNNRFTTPNRNARTISIAEECQEDEECLSALLEAESFDTVDRKN